MLQEAALCPEGTEGGAAESLAGPGVWLLTDTILLTRAWSCASMPRAVGCRWRCSTQQSSRYKVLAIAVEGVPRSFL